MLIYNTTWLQNCALHKEVSSWYQRKLVSKEEKDAIQEAYPVGFFSPGFLVALGLVFFTLLLIGSGFGLLGLFMAGASNSYQRSFQILMLLASITCFVTAEYYKKQKHYYNAGTDNALVWAGAGFLIGFFFWILMDNSSEGSYENAFMTASFVSAAICLLATIRYADVLAAVAAYGFFFTFLFLLTLKAGDTGKVALPFIGLAFSAAVYYAIKKYAIKTIKCHWGACIQVIELLALGTAYLSVNYFVVRELTIEMFPDAVTEGQDIPFAFVFYFLTVAIPLGYIALGLRNKDRNMLRLGLVLVAVAVLTIRHYHSVLPPETAFTLGGAMMMAFAYGVIRYLRQNSTVFTYEEDPEEAVNSQIEGLIVAHTIPAAATPEKGASFNGGQFGGAGASEGY